MATVQLKNICKSYGNRKTVHDLNLTVEDKEFMVLVGPSGCGKSTSLRMIAGLEEITSGTLTIDGVDVTDAPPQKRDIAMVFQSYALYPHMTAYKNMAFGLLRTTRLSKSEIDARIQEAAEILNIRDLLDPKLRNRMRGELKRLHQELGLTVIYVTHDQIEAMTLGTRVAMMSEGRLQQLGAPMEIYMKPANTFVATFIGSPEMALLPCRAEAGGRIGHAAFGEGIAVGGPLPEDVILGIRPEEISFSRQGMARGRVARAELIGAEALVEVALGDHMVTVKSPVADAPAAGSDIGLDFDLTRARLFDASNGQAIARTA